MKLIIQELIRQKESYYKKNYIEMIADYNREEETIKGYNGRQILELLQNCDDEGSQEVLIKLDKVKQQISIHNLGTPFSEKGYRSLFIANLSSKTDNVKYIGNKGLGFRSIINWSTAIEIKSNNLSLYYSEERRKENLKRLFSGNELTRIYNDEGFSNKKIPVPFLTLPRVKEVKEGEYVTSIIINYKEGFLDDIIKQVNDITPETILFLNHINELKFEGFENKKGFRCVRNLVKHHNDKVSPKVEITFDNGFIWDVFEQEELLPDEYLDKENDAKELYQIKIAIERELRATSPYLYSFFPTRISLKQDYILHATFDLDSTRNQINDSKKNRFILDEVVDFTAEVAKYFCSEKVSYKPLKIIIHDHLADTLEELGYYEKINEYLNTNALFPCVDNTYKACKDCSHISDEFAEFLLETNSIKHFGSHLIPMGLFSLDNLLLEPELDRSLKEYSDPINIINEIGEGLITIKDRARFITLIVNNCQFIKEDKELHHKMELLLNKKGLPISPKEYIYTPISKEVNLQVPSFTNIEFIDNSLYEELLNYLGFKDKDLDNKSRFVASTLKGFFNTHSYEPATVANKIISQAKKLISKEEIVNPEEIVKELHLCLYENFKLFNENTVIRDENVVPVIDLNGKVKLSGNQVFSAYYPVGEQTEKLFEGIYKRGKYLGTPQNNGIFIQKEQDEEELNNVQKYFQWLGVNDFVVYEEHNQDSVDLIGYAEFLSKELEITIDPRITANVNTIKDFEEIVRKMPIENFIVWAYYDGTLFNQLKDKINKDSFSYFYKRNNPISEKPSFIKYLIQEYSSIKFSSLLIEEKYSWLNDVKLNYQDPLFDEYDISKREVETMLIMLGAKDNFNHLSIERVTDIINSLPKLYPDGKKSQSIYKAALNHYKENGYELSSPVKLFANNGNKKQVFHQEEIYFSDSIKLPKQLRESYPVFNYPMRAGGNEAIKFFKINDLSDLEVVIEDCIVNDELTSSFSHYFAQIKPLILTYRLSGIEDYEQQKNQASICNKLNIVLCNELSYSVKGNVITSKDYEFVVDKKTTFYVSIGNLNNIDLLFSQRDFKNCISDILSQSFSLRSDYLDTFRSLIGCDLSEKKQDFELDFGEDLMNHANELLGVADHKINFWKSIFKLKGIELNNSIDDSALEILLLQEYKIDFRAKSINYELITIPSSLLHFRNLLNELEIDLEEFSKEFYYDCSIERVHYESLVSTLLPMKSQVKNFVWMKLSTSNRGEKKQFLNEINKFENNDDYLKEKGNNMYTLKTKVCSLLGVGRFVLGLPNEVIIIGSKELKTYLNNKITTVI